MDENKTKVENMNQDKKECCCGKDCKCIDCKCEECKECCRCCCCCECCNK